MASQSRPPVDPVAVVGAASANNLDVSSDGRLCGVEERHTLFLAENPRPAVESPVGPDDLAPGLMWVAVGGPAAEFGEDQETHPGKGPLGADGGVIPGPAPQKRIEAGDEVVLGPVAVRVNHFSDLRLETSLGFVAGRDDRLETEASRNVAPAPQ